MNTKEFSTTVGGKKITALFTDLADQTNGSVIIKCGDTAILATAVMGKRDKEDMPYFPLVVDYEEKFYATGKILGGQYMKREGRPSDEAILAGRMIDRTIRPLFDHTTRRDIQVVATVLSIDEENDPDVYAILASSLALAVSDIPWNGPVGVARVGKKEKGGTLTINPHYSEREEAYADILLCGRKDHINMIEAETKEISEDELDEMIASGLSEIEALEKWQNDIVKELGKEKQEVTRFVASEKIETLFDEQFGLEELTTIVFDGENSKEQIGIASDKWQDILDKAGLAEGEDAYAHDLLHDKIDVAIHNEALTKKRRADGRKLDEIRALVAQAGGISNTVHGMGIFYRGGTHVMNVLTLGGPQDALTIDGMEVRGKKHFLHHYNFPPYSVGETGRMGGINRRSTGHGALAEKALRAVIPSRETFPYTIRLVSESLASNGSTSMGSVCAGTLSLMDGGVPITRPVAGIAMGVVISDDKKEYEVLTDIQGPEDHHGDMDLKVAGTTEGVTALQMDVKVEGVTKEILTKAFAEAKKARLTILKTITDAISAPRAELNPNAPYIEMITIDPEKIGMVIGAGGKTIKALTEETGAEIHIEGDEAPGEISLTGKKDAVSSAKQKIEDMVKEWKVGEVAEAKVIKLFDFGAVVQINEHAEGLVHISEISPERIENIAEYVCPDDTVPVKVIKNEMGKLSFSIKQADPEYTKRRGKKACDAEVIKKSDNGGPRSRPPRR